MSLRVLIVDDEAIGRRRIRRLLAAHGDVQVVAECATGRDAITMLRVHAVDVVFLDIQMPGQDGFDVVRELPSPAPRIVFVTAFSEFALDAFEVEAADYLVKPVSAERLGKTLERVRAAMADRSSAESGRQLRNLVSQALDAAGTIEPRHTASADRLRIRTGDRVVFIRVSDVDWFEADGNNIRAHVAKEVHSFRETVAALEDSLDARQFARIHRSTIVNVDRVRALEPWFGGDAVLILEDGTRLRVSRTYRDALKGRLRVL
jgi:two-component system LytT family response regulator